MVPVSLSYIKQRWPEIERLVQILLFSTINSQNNKNKKGNVCVYILGSLRTCVFVRFNYSVLVLAPARPN